MDEAMNIDRAFGRVAEHYSPRVIARVNDQYVKVAKLKGELAWHKHEEDEMFLVVRGRLRIEREGAAAVELGEGDLYVVPGGTMHNPVAAEECWVMLIETVTTKHTGDVVTDRTKTIEQQLAP